MVLNISGKSKMQGQLTSLAYYYFFYWINSDLQVSVVLTVFTKSFWNDEVDLLQLYTGLYKMFILIQPCVEDV